MGVTVSLPVSSGTSSCRDIHHLSHLPTQVPHQEDTPLNQRILHPHGFPLLSEAPIMLKAHGLLELPLSWQSWRNLWQLGLGHLQDGIQWQWVNDDDPVYVLYRTHISK